MKKCISFKRVIVISGIMAALFLILPGTVSALPDGANVTAGNVGIQRVDPSTLSLTQNSDKAIINWQSFDIAAPEAVHFLQPGASSIALNRVTGTDPTSIDGLLTGNGGIFVINPNGLLIGPSGRIETNSFVGSTLDISDSDFLSGTYLFRRDMTPASVENAGEIQAGPGGFVSLMGGNVKNTGTISAHAGTIGLASGNRVEMTFTGNDLISFAVDAVPDEGSDRSVTNSGVISNPGGEILLTTGEALDVIHSVVNNDGVIEAQSLENKNGVIRLIGGGVVTSSGELDASGKEAGESGGTIIVSGEHTGLMAGSVTDASGDAGGGSVFIGGGVQGTDPEIRNAGKTFVDADAGIRSDAGTTGNGGEIVVRADDSARIHGSISAKGGTLSGNGGFVETSGGSHLEITRTPDVTADNGSGGEWLIDPNNIDIVAGGGNVNINNTNPFQTSDDGAQLGVDLVIAALTGGANVSVTTGTAGGNSENGNITVSTGIDYDGTGSNNLTLSAHGNINVSASISDSTPGGDSLGVTLQADSDANGSGNVTISAPISTGDASFQTSGAGLNTTATGDIDTGSGSVVLNQTGAVSLAGDVSGGSIQSSGTTFANSGAITASGPVDIAHSGLVSISGTVSAASNIAISGTTVNIGGQITTSGAGSLTVDHSGQLTVLSSADMILDGPFLQNGPGAVTTSGDITTTSDDITFLSDVTLGGNISLDTGTGAGSVWFAGTVDGGVTPTITAGTGNVQFDGALGGTTPLGGLSIPSAGAVTFNGPVTTASGGEVSITNSSTLTIASAADMTLDGAFNQNGTGPVYTGGDITTTSDDITFMSPVILTDNVSIDSGVPGGDIRFAGPVDGDFLFGLAASSGSITFDGPLGYNMPLSGLSVVSGSQLTFNDSISADDQGIDINAGTVDMFGPVTTTSGGAVTITNTAPLTIDGFADMHLDGSFLQDGGGPVSTAGDITTTDDDITFTTAVTLTGDAAMDSGTGPGNILFNSTVDGDYLLSLSGGTGDVTFQAGVGSVTPLSGLSIPSADTVTFASTLSADDESVDINGADVTFNDAVTTTNGGNVTVTNSGILSIVDAADMLLDGWFLQDGTGSIVTAGDITTTGDDITFTGGVTMLKDLPFTTGEALPGSITFKNSLDGDYFLTLTAGTGDIRFEGPVGETDHLSGMLIESADNVFIEDSFNADDENIRIYAGNVTIDGPVKTTNNGWALIENSGLLTITGAGNMDLDGHFNQTGMGSVRTAGDITTTADPITFNSDVTLTGVVNLNTGAGVGGSILFSDTLDGDYKMSMTAGTGEILFKKDVGAGVSLSGLEIFSADKAVFQGVLFADDEHIAITAKDIEMQGDVATSSYGHAIFSNTGGLSLMSDVNLDGFFLQDGSGPVFISGNITTTSDSIEFYSDVTLWSGVSMSMGRGLDGQMIRFHDTVDGNRLLTLTAGLGDIRFDQPVGGNVPLAGLKINSAENVWAMDTIDAGAKNIDITAENITLTKNVTTTDGGSVTIVNSGLLTIPDSADMDLDGAFAQSGSGSVMTGGEILTTKDDIVFMSDTTLTDDVTLDTGGGTDEGMIRFGGSVDGDWLLTLRGGVGDVFLDGPVGETEPLSGLRITSADQVVISDTLAASDRHIFIDAGAITMKGPVSTSEEGTVTLINDRDLTLTEMADMDLDGEFLQIGEGPVFTAGDITTTSDDILFSSPVTLTGDVAMSMGEGVLGGKILFPENVDGDFLLTLSAGLGDIGFKDAVGSETPLSGLRITSGANVFFDSFLNADDEGISIAAENIRFSNPVTTTNNGGLTITNSGNFDLLSTAVLTLDGAFIQNGTGPVRIGSDIYTTGDDIRFDGPVTLSASGTADEPETLFMNTGTGPGNIAFQNTLDAETGADIDFTLSAGTGSVGFHGIVGGMEPIRNLTISGASGGVTTTAEVTSDAISISNGGNVDLNANVTAKNGFSSNGTGFDNTGGSIHTRGSSIGIDHQGPVVIGSNLESSGGTVSVSSDDTITMTDGSLIDSGNGAIHVEAESDIHLSGLKTDKEGDNAVVVTSTEGDIIDGGDTYADVKAPNGTLRLTAGGSIGKTDPVDIDAGTLFASAETGSIDIAAQNDLTVGTVATSSGGDISLSADSGHIRLGDVNAGNGTVSLLAGGNIDGGAFHGDKGVIRAATIGIGSVTTADVKEVELDLGWKQGSLSGVLKPGPNFTSMITEDKIDAPGAVFIIGRHAYFADDQKHVEGVMAAEAVLPEWIQKMEEISYQVMSPEFLNAENPEIENRNQ